MVFINAARGHVRDENLENEKVCALLQIGVVRQHIL